MDSRGALTIPRLVCGGLWTADSICAMGWGEIELEPEVASWLNDLDNSSFGRAAFAIDLLEDQGPLLGEPHSRQLRGKLRELRFYLDARPTRITYYIASGRRIILLTVFSKTKPREVREVERAMRAMERCLAAGHTAEDEDG